MAKWGGKERLFVVAVSLLIAASAISGWGYSRIRAEMETTQVKLDQTTAELTQRNAEVQQLEAEFSSLENKHSGLEAEHAATLAELEQSLTAPYTSISGREITWAWRDIDGNIRKWKFPVDGYRSWIEKPKPQETLSLEHGDITYTMVDFRSYVSTEEFTNVVSNFYQEQPDEKMFAQEAFNLISQLTVYSEDIGEVARWPVETLTEAGGDCEDLAILFASLLKAAPYPYKLSLVYMDADNPTNPQRPNHVIVWVEADDWRIFVDCTSAQGWGYYQRVVGWYYKL